MAIQRIYLNGGPGLEEYLHDFLGDEDAIFHPPDSTARNMDDLQAGLERAVADRKPYALIGHSWGGTVALEHLKRNPQGPAAIVLISTPASYQAHADFEAEMARKKISQPSLADIFLSDVERSNPVAARDLEKIFSSFDPEVLKRFEKSYLGDFDLRETLRKAQVPVLVVFGSADARVPAAVQSAYPATLRREIQDAGHFPFLLPEHRKVVQTAIDAFLLRL